MRPAQDHVLDPFLCQMAVHGMVPAHNQAAGSGVASAALPPREDLQNLLSGLARRVA